MAHNLNVDLFIPPPSSGHEQHIAILAPACLSRRRPALVYVDHPSLRPCPLLVWRRAPEWAQCKQAASQTRLGFPSLEFKRNATDVFRFADNHHAG